MATRRQTGQTRWAWQLLSHLASGSIGLSLTILTGCSSTPTTSQQTHDPLTGSRTPPGPTRLPSTTGPTASNDAAPAPISAQGGLPPVPTTLSATNTASIAGSPVGSLAITDNPGAARAPVPGQLTNDPKAPQGSAQSPGYPANASPHVEQVPNTGAASPAFTPVGAWQAPPGPSSSPPAAAAPVAPAALTGSLGAPTPLDTGTAQPVVPSATELMHKQLQDHGVSNEKLDPTPDGGVHLTCFVRGAPGSELRIYEATAADYPAAADAVLRQLP